MAKQVESTFSVFCQRDGIVNHRHDGVQGWHNPASSHKSASHVGADKPANLASLSAELAAQYAKALAGESFYGLYVTALTARREAGEVPQRTAKVTATLEAVAPASLALVPAQFDRIVETFTVNAFDESEGLAS